MNMNSGENLSDIRRIKPHDDSIDLMRKADSAYNGKAEIVKNKLLADRLPAGTVEEVFFQRISFLTKPPFLFSDKRQCVKKLQ